MKLRIHRIREGALLPTRATPGSAGLDLAASIPESIQLLAGGWARIPVGIAIALPEGYEAQVRPRSGLTSKLGIVGAFGTIDSDYRGEIMVTLFNHSKVPFTVNPGDRIGQLVVAPVAAVEIDEVSTIFALGMTKRGAGGFGSTGLSAHAEESDGSDFDAADARKLINLLEHERETALTDVARLTAELAECRAARQQAIADYRNKNETLTSALATRDKQLGALMTERDAATHLLHEAWNNGYAWHAMIDELTAAIDAVSPDHDHGMLQVDWDEWRAIVTARNALRSEGKEDAMTNRHAIDSAIAGKEPPA